MDATDEGAGVGDVGLTGLSETLRNFVDEAPEIRRPSIGFLRRAATELGPGATVLDVGAGAAPYRELFDGLTYVTVDWSESQHAPEPPVDIVAPASAIPLDDAVVDGIVCTQVLEHVAEVGQVLNEFQRLLKPGGSLWLTVPLTWYLHEVPYDFYRYTPWGLRYVLERSGFTDIDIRPMNNSLGTLAELLRHAQWILGQADDGLNERRFAVGAMLSRLASTVESVGYLDTQLLLPLSLSARAVKPTDAAADRSSGVTAAHVDAPGPFALQRRLAESPDPASPSVSVIVTGHREGALAHHTMRSVAHAVADAKAHGLDVELVCALDRADDSTRDFFTEALGASGYFVGLCGTSLIEVDHGDPGLARNAAVEVARGRFVAVMDADNLISSNWLVAAVAQLNDDPNTTVVHPEHLITFGARHVIWPQIPSDAPGFQIGAFYAFNYWDSCSLAARDLYRTYPYQPSGSTFGPEDWHWNTVTAAGGVRHTVAPETALFYRVKHQGSRNQQVQPAGRPLNRTPLLTDRGIADASTTAAAVADFPPAVVTPAVKQVLDEFRGAPDSADNMLRVLAEPAAGHGARRRFMRRVNVVNPAHYRALYADLAHLPDTQLVRHYAVFGRTEGRRPSLSDEDRALLRPDIFKLSHYRLLNPDLAGASDAELVIHYLNSASAESRRARLTDRELDALLNFDVNDYRALNQDLSSLSDDALVAHFVVSGIDEGRRARLRPSERPKVRYELPEVVLAAWRAAHSVEPALPVPSPDVVASYDWYWPAEPSQPPSSVWWRVVKAMPDKADFIFFAPWIRMGGADAILARYARLVSERSPDDDVVVVTTEASSTHTEWLPPNVRLVELPSIDGYLELSRAQQSQLIATVVVQYAPRAIHMLNSPAGFDAIEAYSKAMVGRTKLFLSTFVIDRGPQGNMFNWMFNRHPSFLDDVTAVIVDNEALVDQFWELYRYPREKFLVHHQPVDIPDISIRDTQSTNPTCLDVLWAARFDRQKRPDILAGIVAECSRRGLPVRFHVYGAAVTDSTDEYRSDLDRMSKLGVIFYQPYRRFADVQTDRIGLFLMTSQWEGMPLTLLDAMAYGIPVVASAVGGVTEILDTTTGYPVERFDDIDAYVAGIEYVISHPDIAESWATCARRRLAKHRSTSAWEKSVDATLGYLR